MLRMIIEKIKSLLLAYPYIPALGLFLLGLIVFLVVAINQLGLDKDQESTSSPSQTQSESTEVSDTDTSDDQSDQSNSPTPTPKSTTTPTVKVVSTSTPTPTTKQNNPTNTPTSAPTSTPTPSPTSIPEGTCSISATPASGDSPLSVQFAYQASYVNSENYVTAVQWDFDGDGDWDTDMGYEEVNKRPIHIYYTGNYTVKMHLTLVSGYVTDVCTINISAN